MLRQKPKKLKTSRNNVVIVSAFAASALLLSFLRENAFLVINGIINGKGSYKANTTPPEWLLTNFSIKELSYMKWPLTIVFCALFMFLTIFAVKHIFEDKRYVKLVKSIYTTLFVIGGMLLILYYTLGKEYEGIIYHYIHLLFKTLQSPLIMLIIIPLLSAKEQLGKVKLKW
jgi:hypothetical protein